MQSKIEKIEEEHRIELKVQKAKIRSSEYEHQLALSDLEEKGDQKTMEEDTQHRNQLETFNSEKEERIQKFDTLDSINQDSIKDQKEDKTFQNDRDFGEWDSSLKVSQKTWDRRLKKIKEDLELRLKIEIHEIEERLNAHINCLLRQHEND